MEAINDLGLNIKSNIEVRTTQDDSKPLFDGKYTDWHNGYSFFVLKKWKILVFFFKRGWNNRSNATNIFLGEKP